MRLIHPVTYVTIQPHDLLSSQPDGEIEPEKEGGGEGVCLKTANQHACVIWAGPQLSGQSVYIKLADGVKARFIDGKQC